ncbi:MAG: hypothetical protein JW723_05870 [Bacteroidales bacterium]|nr:hypothetical protein [Bacteroidales bacterium]
MDTQPKLIHKSERTHLTSNFPVYYFGTSHAKVYAVYSISWGGTYILIAAMLEEFSYNYEEEKLFNKNRPVLIPQSVLNGNEKMKEIHTSNFDKDRLTEIVAKSFLNEALGTQLPVGKTTGSKVPKTK